MRYCRIGLGGTNFGGLRFVPLAPYAFSPAGENR